MSEELKKNFQPLSLAINSTDNSFGFAYREDKNDLSDNFFVKKFEKDLCNNLIVDFYNFIPKENLQKIDKISVSFLITVSTTAVLLVSGAVSIPNFTLKLIT